jgi:hypothetical protein
MIHSPVSGFFGRASDRGELLAPPSRSHTLLTPAWTSRALDDVPWRVEAALAAENRCMIVFIISPRGEKP